MRKYKLLALIPLLLFGGQGWGQTLSLGPVKLDAPPTVTVTANPASGPAPLNVTLTWNSTNADTCTEGGVTHPIAGSRVINGIMTPTTFNITCTGGKNYTDVTWTAPTTNTDGTPIPATGPLALAGFKLYYARTAAAVDAATPVIIAPELRTYRITGQTNSDYFYKLSAFNVEGGEGPKTDVITNNINRVSVTQSANVAITAPPNPPGTVVIAPDQIPPVFSTTYPTVYNIVKKANGLILLPVGSVPLNTPCDVNVSVNGYNAVPVAAVNSWSGSVRPIVVVAQCTVH
jgi:hypothetical protein